MKKDVAFLGFIIGLLAPLLGLFIVCYIWAKESDFGKFINRILHDHDLEFKVVSLSLIINLVPFLLFSNKRRDQSAKGVLIATMLYFVYLILIKYVWN